MKAKIGTLPILCVRNRKTAEEKSEVDDGIGRHVLEYNGDRV